MVNRLASKINMLLRRQVLAAKKDHAIIKHGLSDLRGLGGCQRVCEVAVFDFGAKCATGCYDGEKLGCVFNPVEALICGFCSSALGGLIRIRHCRRKMRVRVR